MRKQSGSLGPTELGILQYIGDHHPIRVAEVAEHFAQTAGKARTTVLTVMERLRGKGFLSRKKIRGTWHYAPKLAKGTLLQNLIQRFVDESLEGSLAPFMAYLAETDSMSDEEFEKLKSLVKELETRREGEEA